MTKKLICLMLALLLVLPVLASCSKDNAIDDTIEEASRYTTTLNVWMICEEGMDQAQAEAVSKAINKLTKNKFKTQLNFKFYTESEYYAKLEEAFGKQDSGEAVAEKTQTSGAEETYFDEYGMVQLKYPEVSEYAVDILFLGNFEKFYTYVQKEWLAPLSTQLIENQELYSAVNNTLLTSAKIKKEVYALPNNHAVGEYTFIAADKDLLAEYTTIEGNVNVFDKTMRDYLDYIYNQKVGADKVYPIYSETGTIDVDLTHYWSAKTQEGQNFYTVDASTFSVFGTIYEGQTDLNCDNLLADSDYMKRLANKVYYENTADYITTDSAQKAAIRVVQGGLADKQALEDAGYEIILTEAPTMTDEEVFSSMFAVGKRSASISRSAEIITYFNSDAEVRNLLQYGIEDVNYTVATTRLSGVEYKYAAPIAGNGYKMSLNKTGNMFIAYADSADTVLDSQYGKLQNLDLVTYPGIGIYFDLSTNKIDLTAYNIVTALSAKVKTYLDSLTSSTDVLGLCSMASSKVTDDNAQMAYFLLGLVGSFTYKDAAGETQTINATDLADAMTKYSEKREVVTPSYECGIYTLYRLWYSTNATVAVTQ